MGTSRSKPDAPPGSPLVPPWAAKDPPPAEIPDGTPGATDKPSKKDTPEAKLAPEDVASAKRYAGFRMSLGRFASSGSNSDARTALRRWATTSVGGARAFNRRLSRAKTAGGAALAGLARAQENQPPVTGALDIRTLGGQSVDVAITRIIDAFCPTGILDEELARLAMGEALAIALAGADTFDPVAISADAVRVATLTFVAELVFVSVVGDGKESLSKAPTPAAAIQREANIRAIIRAVADTLGTPVFEAAGGVLTPNAMTSLVSRLVQVVLSEMQSWEE